MKLTGGILLGTLLLAACGHSDDNKPALLEQQRDTLNKAKQVDSMLQQQTQQQKQETDKQTQ